MNKLFILVLLMLSFEFAFGQTSNIQVQVNNAGREVTSDDYKINGISKTLDIGGVDVTAKITDIDLTYDTNNPYRPTNTIHFKAVSGVTLTNYNSRSVTVILRLQYTTNDGLRTYPRYYNEEEKIMTVVIPSYRSSNHSKFIALPHAGKNYPREITSADMIVRPIQ